MVATRTLEITLPADMADRLEARVASGRFASESEAVMDGLATLFKDDDAIEKMAGG